ncbi:MAG TPA: tetratricopeptide repeat protein [Terracidiphilus sp.]|nr:tetratricopeptide repeat protein [Terracidiphilus sp.]
MGLTIAIAFSTEVCAHGQSTGDSSATSSAADRGRILLVLPFDNRTGQPSLEWIREAAAELISSRFRSVGFEPMSRSDRRYALDHLGLPQGFQPSRASSLKLAQTLDADSIVVGSYLTDGTGILAEARLVDVPHLRMSEAVTARGEMRNLVDVFDSLAWKLTRQLDPRTSVAEATFIAAGKGMRLDAFEQYIRGITEPDQAERLRHLEQAVKLSPEFGPALMDLGREYYNGQQYEQAADAFAKVDKNGPDGLEAGYYRGLSLLFSGDYAKAEQAFADVARILPLAEVVNNEAVAVSRQGHDGTGLFVQAAADDPNSADYHFNLAVSLKHHGQTPGAMNELAQCLRLRPTDSEALALQVAWKQPAAPQAAQAAAAPNASPDADEAPDPLERIVRSFDAAAFRQAAMMLDEVDASRLATFTPPEQAQKLSAQARSFLDRGLLLEAERLYQSAVAADGKCAEAHAGLAQVRERTGAADTARNEANTALKLKPSTDAYLVLGRLDLASNHLSEASNEAAEALKLEPTSQAAQELSRQVQARTGH